MSTFMLNSIFILIIIYFCFGDDVSKNTLQMYSPIEVSENTQVGCVVLLNAMSNRNFTSLITKLKHVYIDDQNISIGVSDFDKFWWSNGEKLRLNGKVQWYASAENDILLFRKQQLDRNCLIETRRHSNPLPELYTGVNNIDTLVDYVNQKCDAYRDICGDLTHQGAHKKYILQNLFTASLISNISILDINKRRPYTSSYLYKGIESHTLNDSFCTKNTMEILERKCEVRSNTKPRSSNVLIKTQCERIKVTPDSTDFFHNYFKISKPVIFENAVKSWPAYKKWSNEYLRQRYGEWEVHVKLTPGGDFEGVEKAELWDNFKDFKIPDYVRNQLPFQDLVVVRPAGLNMKFKEFLDLITLASEQPERNVSAYLEYSSIPNYMPELEEDLKDFVFVKDLKRAHLNMWLSDGHTLGRLHFDPFDNLLCQIRGKKQVIMFEPHDNKKLYEAHIPQATLSYNKETKEFRRARLEDSTSMVMSPVDILNPDFERFPKFKNAIPMNCTINEGDVLFMPAFWWHEVYSWPNAEEKRNLAVNFWYEPFLQKEFPCPECKLDVNPYYRHLL